MLLATVGICRMCKTFRTVARIQNQQLAKIYVGTTLCI